MAIPEKLLQFKYPLAIAMSVTTITVSIFYVAPRFLTILAYFWPLFLSTSVFLVAMLVFGGISPSVLESHGEKAGEGLLDYVAARPQHVEERYDS